MFVVCSAFGDPGRQESCPMETLRLKEESLAWAQWQEILNQCKQVCNHLELLPTSRSSYIIYFYTLSLVCVLQRGSQFVDETFSAAPRSLYYSGGGEAEQPAARWLRPRHIHTDPRDAPLPWAVFRHPRPSDISQGKPQTVQPLHLVNIRSI